MVKLLCIVTAVLGLIAAPLVAQDAPAAASEAAPAADAATPSTDASTTPGGTIDPLPKRLLKSAGSLHPAAVHMPIGLLTMAAIFIVLRRLFPSISPDVAYYSLLLGTAGAVGATVAGFGWATAKGYTDGGEIFWHRWGGVIVSVTAVAVSALAIHARLRPQAAVANVAWQLGALALAGMVGMVGHQGGSLVHGEDLYAKALDDLINPKPKVPYVYDPPVAPELKVETVAAAPAVARIDFVKQVMPVLQAKCIGCHGPEKDKGGLRLDTEEFALAGGDSGPAYVPGNAAESLILKLMSTPDEDERMPPPSKTAVTPEEYQTLKQWVEQGAIWSGPGAKVAAKVSARAN